MVFSMAEFLSPGDPAPDFSAIAVGGAYGDGTTVRRSDFQGKPCVLYFYPRDATPGCTIQACAIRDNYGDILATGAALFGVSVDSPQSHAKFIAKRRLPFPLLSDENHEIVEAYGVWGKRSFLGKSYMGTERCTFVVGADGRIQAIFRKVKPGDHIAAVLNALRPHET
jgi:thioredoxin-dependent peroxiredoxin